MSTTQQGPLYTAYIVEKKDPTNREEKGYWHEVGKVWPHGKGDGLSLVIFPGVAVSGRIELVKPKPKDGAPVPTE